jgi:hypothetical protein
VRRAVEIEQDDVPDLETLRILHSGGDGHAG